MRRRTPTATTATRRTVAGNNSVRLDTASTCCPPTSSVTVRRHITTPVQPCYLTDCWIFFVFTNYIIIRYIRCVCVCVCGVACGDGCLKCSIETTSGTHTPTCQLCRSGYVLSGGTCLSKHSMLLLIVNSGKNA